ncbi:MAG: tetratricopeptide repeat protein [Rhodomicrobium sp.]|nr:tetratricopeptide repeat protein [Rhodomicrobium sp.]
MSHDNESFFREVEEDYRREQAIKFFKTYGAYFIAGAFVIAAVALGYTIEQQRRASHAAKGGDALTSALLLIDAGKADEAKKALSDLAANGPGAYPVLARLQEAAGSAAKNQLDAARANYSAVAADESAPSTLRDFARMQLASLSVDKESYESLARGLESYRSGTSPWRFSAKEILGLAAYREGKKAEAERLFGEIVSDGEAPQGMRQRAEVMLALLLEKPKPAQAELTGKKDAANDAKTQ